MPSCDSCGDPARLRVHGQCPSCGGEHTAPMCSPCWADFGDPLSGLRCTCGTVSLRDDIWTVIAEERAGAS